MFSELLNALLVACFAWCPFRVFLGPCFPTPVRPSSFFSILLHPLSQDLIEHERFERQQRALEDGFEVQAIKQ